MESASQILAKTSGMARGKTGMSKRWECTSHSHWDDREESPPVPRHHLQRYSGIWELLWIWLEFQENLYLLKKEAFPLHP